ncbi:MAG: LptF/LptG family permease [Helicobacteraceae bacterium]|nr:LptF/LptG family permease [Helicobacteraceae bacterium]
MLSTKYIAFHYLKYFSLILLALVLFMTGFDYMENASRLPDSANLVLLYIMYVSFFAIDMLLPIALIFAMISTKIFLIRSNALVAFYSLGYSKTDILRPFIYVSLAVVLIFISLHATSFARADEYAKNIRENSQHIKPSKNLFFIHEDRYIYFEVLDPIAQSASGIRIFIVKNNSLKSVLTAKNAFFKDKFWHIKRADLITKPDEISFENRGITVTKESDLKILEGFKPKILDQVYEGKVNYTIADAFDAKELLSKQNINSDRVVSAIYKIFVYPFFVPALVVIIFFFVPISVRFLNVSLFSFGAIVATLLIWGVLFTLIELASTKTISANIGILTPVLFLITLSILQWRRQVRRV